MNYKIKMLNTYTINQLGEVNECTIFVDDIE